MKIVEIIGQIRVIIRQFPEMKKSNYKGVEPLYSCDWGRGSNNVKMIEQTFDLSN